MAFQWVNGRLELAKNKTAFRNFASKGTVAFLMITQVWGLFFGLTFIEKFRANSRSSCLFSWTTSPKNYALNIL